jgi:phytoene desaturase
MPYTKQKVVIIGAGFAGLAAAACLAQKGYQVTILEKNTQPGGRARMFEEAGFRFDMGPSWYWMPDIVEDFMNRFGYSSTDFYSLKKLDPAYAMFFGKSASMHLPANPQERIKLFESYEPGSGIRLANFLQEAAYKYAVGIREFAFKPGRSAWELFDLRLWKSLFKLHLFTSFQQYISRFFHHPYLIQSLVFPSLFLGAAPQKTPALYSMMNYADIALGTWYPMGGMHELVKALLQINQSLGTSIITQAEVKSFDIQTNHIQQVHTANQSFQADIVIANADYQHIEQHLLPAAYRTYSKAYWDKRTLAPSCLIYYLGLNRKLDRLLHHNLFFHASLPKHLQEIYEAPQWPSDPLFYVSCTSKTDPMVAPAGCENLFILIPVAPGLQDSPSIRTHYLQHCLQKMEELLGEPIQEHIIYQKSYGYQDFVSDYHAFKGNAYGLATTLLQTAFLRPSLQSKKIPNLYYTGQFTVPVPGIPPAIISGQVVAQEIYKNSL